MQVVLLMSVVLSVIFLTVYGAGIYPWSVLLVAVCLSGITCFCVYRKSCSAVAMIYGGRRSFYRVVFIAIVGFILLTLVPLPKPVTIITGATRYKQNCTAAEIIDRAVKLDICKPVPYWFSTTRNRAGTLRILLLLAAVFSAFEAVQLLSWRNRMIYLHIMVVLGLIVAVLGYFSFAVWPQGNKFWWLFSAVKSYNRYPVGGFLNINHYAGFTALLAIMAFGLAAVNLFAKHWGGSIFTFISALIMSGMIANATSRGALVAFGVGIFVLGILVLAKARGGTRLIALSLIALAIITTVTIGFRNPKVRERIALLRHPYSDPGGNPRLNAWAGAFHLWKSYPLIGVGANAFKYGYLQHKDTHRRAYRRFAENEFFQILSEGGVIGIGLASVMLFAILNVLFRNIYHKYGDNSVVKGESVGCIDNRMISICAVAVLATAGAHSMFDFILHLPLYAILLATIISACMPVQETTNWRKTSVTLMFMIAISLIPLLKPLTKFDKDGFVITADNNRLAKLFIWSPTNTVLWRRFGARIQRGNTPETKSLAKDILEQVTVYDPTNFNVWINLGKFRLKEGDKSGAKECFDRAKSIRIWAAVPKIE